MLRRCMTRLCAGGAAAAAPVGENPQQTVRSVYMDLQATTPLDPRVLDAMLPFFTEKFGNAHSRTHEYGWVTETAVDKARKQIADLIGASPKEIFFTSGATESNNIAIKGVADFNKANKKHIITLQTEHKCVLDSCRYLEMAGFDVTYLPVGTDGLVDLEKLEAAIRPDTALVSCMFVNNEIGVLQDVAEIGRLCRKKKVFFHTDGAQAVGKVPIDVNKMNIDLMSISGHKLYGPKGVGALYLRRRPRVRVRSPISGGGQERGVRSGTLASPLCVGLGAACDIAGSEMVRDTEHVKTLSKQLWDSLSAELSHININGHKEKRYPGNLNISFECVEGESLLMGMNEVAVSSGSACTSASLEPSYVLRAIGVDAETAHTSIRFGLGRFTTPAEVAHTADKCIYEVKRLREMSPLWHMKMDGGEINWRK